KLTTWRLIGAEAASLALADLGIASPDGRPAPLPGAAPLQKVEDAIARAHGDLPARVRRHLAGHYGMLALDVLATAAHDPGLLEPIRPEGPDIWAQVVHAHEHEWAATVDDVASGRTTLHVRGQDDDRTRDRIGRMLAAGAPA
ncbi:MAG: glycerol-3-phosphate dehydrogenase C-terminal domain-containing protein, partial [Gaiellales bacterium]